MSASGRKASTWDIRERVEEYAGMSNDAFDRRFYADREELARLGIRILSEGGEGRAAGFPETTLYWLPPENYFLPPIDFSPEELAALGSCLSLLGGQFAYGDVLRIALQGLALGAGNPQLDLAPGYINVNLLASGFDAVAAGHLAKIETAIARKKTLLFEYRAAGRETAAERRVDPYSLLLTRGDWYLAGYSHERSDIRIFKLGRIYGKIRNATRAEHDFSLPEDFDRSRYENLEPWQLGTGQGVAKIRLSPRISWWVERNLSHAGKVEPGGDESADRSHHESNNGSPDGLAKKSGQESDDGSTQGFTVFSTAYSDEDRLCSLVLGMEADAVLTEPASLRKKMLSLLRKIESLHSGPVLKAAGAAPVKQPQAGRPPAPGQVKPERFIRLSTLATFLTNSLGDQETCFLDAGEVSGKLGYDSVDALAKDLELLLMVSIDAGGYLVEGYVEDGRLRVERCVYGDLVRRPARLSPLEARALLLTIDLLGGYVLAGSGNLVSARQKIVAAAGGDSDRLAIAGKASDRDAAIAGAVARGLQERQLVEIEYLSFDGELARKRKVEPYLITNTKGEWYLVAYCHRARAVRVFNFGMIKSASLLKEEFQPRYVDLDPYRADPLQPSGAQAPFKSRVWFASPVAALAGEKQSETSLLEDGSLIAEIDYFNKSWLVREVLKYAGDAVVLSPAEQRRLVAKTAGKLASLYS